jgi:hypothetical protein
MDLNTLDAIGSLLGGIGSILGLFGIFYAVTEVRRARLTVDRETDYRIYQMMLDLDRFFFENPDIKPYIYDGRGLPDDADETLTNRVNSAAELMVDFMECTYSQFELMTIYQRVGWIEYMIDLGQSSPPIRALVDDNREWYMASFVHLLLDGEYDPRLDKHDAMQEWRRLNKAHWRNRLAHLLRDDRAKVG